VHEGAVYLHMGESYVVRELDQVSRAAVVTPFRGDYYTQAKKETRTEIMEPLRVERRCGLELSFGRVATLWLPMSLVESVQRRSQIVELHLLGHPDDPLRIRPIRLSRKQLVADFAATGVPIREAVQRAPLAGLRRWKNWRGIGLIVAMLLVACVVSRRPVAIGLLVVAVVCAGSLVEVLRLLTGRRPERILQGLPDGTWRPVSAVGRVP